MKYCIQMKSVTRILAKIMLCTMILFLVSFFTSLGGLIPAHADIDFDNPGGNSIDFSGIVVPPVNGPDPPPNTGSDSNPQPDPNTNNNTSSGNDTNSNTNTNPGVDTNTNTNTGTDTNINTNTNTNTNNNYNPSPVPKPKPEPKPKPQSKPKEPDPADEAKKEKERAEKFKEAKQKMVELFSIPDKLMADVDLSLPVVNDTSIVDTSVLGNGAIPASIKQGGVLTDEQWKQAKELQGEIDTLYKKWPLSAEESARLDLIELKRNALWKIAISYPGLTAEERERIRLQFHVQSSLPVDTSHIQQWNVPPPPLTPMPDQKPDEPVAPALNPVIIALVSESSTEKADSVIEEQAEKLAKESLGDHGENFGDFLGIGKIAMAYKDGGAASALAETANFIVGKIPFPTASLAVEGGRLYADTAFQAQNKFMKDAMSATGENFDADKFWEDIRNESSTGQRAVMEWVGYGNEK